MPITLRIIHFDVSQGESTLISVLGGKALWHVLIDGGRLGRGEYVKRCLVKLGVTKLTYAICTHLDGDHHEGLIPVIEAIETTTLLRPKAGYDDSKFSGLATACKEAKSEVEVEEAKVGTLFTEGNLAFKIVHVGTPTLNDDNPASIGCLITFNSFTYFTAGDLPSDQEEKLSLPKHVCAFKCGHHGADTSTSTTLLANISPSAAFISAGRHNHEHPRQSVIDNLLGCKSLQRFYATNCHSKRSGLEGGLTTKRPLLGVAASKRSAGILGHLVLLTDEKHSQQHDGKTPTFWVLLPPLVLGSYWRLYVHGCSAKYVPKAQIAPSNLKAALPPYKLTKLSTTVEDFATEHKRKREDESYKPPSSPIRFFIDDEDNFEGPENKRGAPPKKKKKREHEHPEEDKRLGACCMCNGKVSEKDEVIECEHGYAWVVCGECVDEKDEFLCPA